MSELPNESQAPEPGVNETPTRKRHGCLTAILIVFAIMTFVSSVINLVMSGTLAENLPGAPEWAPVGILAMGGVGLLGVAALVALWFWKRWGLYVFVVVGVTAFVLNLALGAPIFSALMGLAGVALVLIFVLRQWGDFE